MTSTQLPECNRAKAIDVFDIGDWVQLDLPDSIANGCDGRIVAKTLLYVEVALFTGSLAGHIPCIEFAGSLRRIPPPPLGHFPNNVHVTQELPP